MKKTILLVLLISCSLWTVAQESEKVADETTIEETKTGFKLNTCNDSIYRMIENKFPYTRLTITPRKDRFGPYREYVFYYKKEAIEEIRKYFAKL